MAYGVMPATASLHIKICKEIFAVVRVLAADSSVNHGIQAVEHYKNLTYNFD